MTNAPHQKPAATLWLWADELDALADRFCEQLDYEGYTGLSEHAAELKAVAALLDSTNRDSHLAKLVEQARDHARFIKEAFDEEESS